MVYTTHKNGDLGDGGSNQFNHITKLLACDDQPQLQWLRAWQTPWNWPPRERESVPLISG